MLLDSGLSASMWILAAEKATYVYNRRSHWSNSFQVPLMKYAPGSKLYIDKLQRFGCVSYLLGLESNKKFDPRERKTVSVGHSKTGYKLWKRPTGKFIILRNVRFNERVMYRDAYKTESTQAQVEENQENIDSTPDEDPSNPNEKTAIDLRREEINVDETPHKEIDAAT